MTTTEAIEKLEAMQKQVVHGSNIFGDIADVIRGLEVDASIGQKWHRNSAIEEWFPLSAEELEKLRKDNLELRKRICKLEMACHLALMFHAAGPWTDDSRQLWAITLTNLLGPAAGRDPKVVGAHGDGTWDGAEPTNEATTKNLCNAVRAALKE